MCGVRSKNYYNKKSLIVVIDDYEIDFYAAGQTRLKRLAKKISY